MPITEFQGDILRLLASHRSPDSFIMGATVVNALPESPRFSQDIDISHDLEESVVESASRDGEVLQQQGYRVQWLLRQPLFHRAMVERGTEKVKLEWVFDSAFRFFPVEPDPQCGWRLNLYDAATNKVLALAGRVKARDFLDVIYLHRQHLSLAALCWAAAGKDMGMNPKFILEEAKRTAHYTAADFEAIHLAVPLDLPTLYDTWRAALAEADRLVAQLPPEEVGCLYLDAQNRPVTPDPDSPSFSRLRRHFGSVRGAWPVVRD